MLGKLRDQLKVITNRLKILKAEEIFTLAGILLAIVVSIWVMEKPKPDASNLNPPKEEGEIGLVVPAGFVVLPLELQNAQALASLVTGHGLVDLYEPGRRRVFLEALKIFRLEAGEGPLFGALVPSDISEEVARYFAKPVLVGAIRAATKKPTRLHVEKLLARPVLTTVPIEEERP